MLRAVNIFKIIREIDLDKVKQEAESRFTLLVAGPEALAQRLAAGLSEQQGKTGLHPWLVIAPVTPAPSEPARYDLALLVTETPEPSGDERQLLRRLAAAKVDTVVVIVGEAWQKRTGAELPGPGEKARIVLPSLEPRTVKEQLAPVLVRSVEPSLGLRLARQLPPLRDSLIHGLVEETSRANALYTASSGLAKVIPILNIPLNVADIVVLTKNQLVMAYKIALATGKRGEPRSVMGEIVGVVGGGFFFRQVARELVGLVPVFGIVPNIAVSYAGTKVIGRSVYLWACRGETLGKGELQRFYREALAQGNKLAKALVARLGRKDKEKPALPAPRDDLN